MSKSQIATGGIADDAVTTAKTSYSAFPFRNIIINGDMSLAQRGTSTSSLSSGATFGAVDRFRTYIVSGGTWTMSQDSTVPTGQGFAKSTKLDCTTANGSLSAGSLLQLQTPLEGQNLQMLKKGTSNAESVTWSFWVRSAKTGTYICEIRDVDNSRSISKSYTISSADTWEKKTITFDGDTTGTLGNDNGKSFELIWWLVGGTSYTSGTLQTSWGSQTDANRAVGVVNLADSTSNDWYITGVQLEVGTSASDFEFLPHDVNLQRCKRYFQIIGDGASPSEFFASVANYNGTYIFGTYRFMPEMRSAPTISSVTGTDYYAVNVNSTADTFNEVKGQDADSRSCQLYADALVSGTVGHAGNMKTNNASAKVTADAEL